MTPCPSCQRHVQETEATCPFCNAALPPMPRPLESDPHRAVPAYGGPPFPHPRSTLWPVLVLGALLALGWWFFFARAEGQEATPKAATGRRVAIAAAAHEASLAGLEVFEAGGNVVDAAVAVTFAISVTRPQSTGIGGGGFVIVRDGKTGDVEALDAREVAPRAATREMYHERPDESLDGPRSVAVPGLVPGTLELHARRGRLPLARVLAPAIRLAKEGFEVPRGLAAACRERKAVLERDAAASKIFLPGGKPLRSGERLVQADLARTLEAIAANGSRAFGEGPIAEAIEKATGGFVTRQDLAAYRPKKRDPIRGTYRGHEVVSFPPPSSGGVHLVQMLNMLEPTNLKALDAGKRAHLLSEVMRRAYRDRAEYLGDPDFAKVPARGLTSKEYARALAAAIEERATPSAKLAPGPAPRYESDQTTHFSIVDGEGNAVASTQTINYTLGSCVVAPGTGIVLNDEMDDFAARPGEPNAYGLIQGEANSVGPGKRPLSSMTPTLVVKEGQVVLALGSPGGSRIITAVLQTIVNRLDLDLSPELAVAAPRIHHQWMPDEVRSEREVPEEVRRELERRGHKVNVVGPGSDIQAVFRLASGELVAVSDPRAEGRPAAR